MEGSNGPEPELPEHAFTVMRCSACGDTFPAEGTVSSCRTCGSAEIATAVEPLL
ncbi:MAG: hypothetical protein H0T12_00435 [Actinobacteria bacterium]|nr:hypothetical protein [Actinomycetota bacterium]